MSLEHYPGERGIGYPPDPLDSFGRARVANPFNIFSAQFNYDGQSSLFQQSVVGGNISHIQASSAVRLSNGGVTIGNTAIFQSKKYFRYQPGIAHNTIWTCVLGTAEPGVDKTIGLYDDEDGLAFVLSESGVGVLRRTSTSGTPVDVVVMQNAWNLDTLDGTKDSGNPSGINLQTDKNNIFVIDMQWLGAGRVRYGFDFSGHITYCHQLQWANTNTVPYMRTGNLPFRAQIENVDVADGVATFDFTCVTIKSGGGSEPDGLMRSASNAEASAGATPLRSVSSGNEPLPVISIRPRTTFNSLANRGLMNPMQCQVASKDAPIAYAIIKNGTLTGASFVDADTADSLAEVDISATAITGGVAVATGYLGAGAGMQAMETILMNIDTVLSNNIAGDSTDILSLVISLAGGASSDCAGAFTWAEHR